MEFISPSSKLIPSKFWKLILHRTRTRRLAWFKELFPQQDITGLSSAKSHGKSVVDEVFSPQRSPSTLSVQQSSYPQQVTINTQQSISIPTEYHSPAWSLEYLSPRRIFHSPSLFRNGVIFSYRYPCSYYPQRKQNLFFDISPGYDFPAPVKDLLS